MSKDRRRKEALKEPKIVSVQVSEVHVYRMGPGTIPGQALLFTPILEVDGEEIQLDLKEKKMRWRSKKIKIKDQTYRFTRVMN